MIDKQVDTICEINNSCKNYIEIKNDRKVIYLIIKSDLYNTLLGVILWYKLLVSKVISFSFILNPYDLCVVNANINKKQRTISFHVGDYKSCYEDPKVVKKVINMLESVLGKIFV